jgi:hypothetical protein
MTARTDGSAATAESERPHNGAVPLPLKGVRVLERK